MTRTLTRWTLDDYHRMIANGLLAGRQVELIDGKIVDMAPELPIHRATYRRGVRYLEALLKEKSVVFSAAPVSLPSDGEPELDICVVIPPESRYDDRHPGPEDISLLIEVSNSTLAYDLGEKARIYAKDGIQEYWVIDIKGRQLWIHREPIEAAYRSIVKRSVGKISPINLPGIAVEVERLLNF
ncbi:Uma2 family endonuclease [cf. Phormidesmis sp. LEGE 11477]|uniref:Uma2 family endonuclease n=1 Tax=cf. Phormidesmis sp. LEGE 11477 TaxID=1828680 RepID=UPI00187ECF19|nr:Uma2 family endonuclease [cf. Phormidesmis sp. LEGE 11477]MBE9059496.1 Uma2 family endonuclease [cf. Phormidesmis sp. LEGE 11477]